MVSRYYHGEPDKAPVFPHRSLGGDNPRQAVIPGLSICVFTDKATGVPWVARVSTVGVVVPASPLILSHTLNALSSTQNYTELPSDESRCFSHACWDGGGVAKDIPFRCHSPCFFARGHRRETRCGGESLARATWDKISNRSRHSKRIFYSRTSRIEMH